MHYKKILDLATEEGHLAKFRGKHTLIRTSMYADDTTVFIKPYNMYVTSLAEILAKFGDALG